MNELLIGITTTETREEAENLANAAVHGQLAACAQVDGPLLSIYPWKGKIEESSEYRLILKTIPGKREALTAWILKNHSYEIPQWIVVASEAVSPAYLAWAEDWCNGRRSVK